MPTTLDVLQKLKPEHRAFLLHSHEINFDKGYSKIRQWRIRRLLNKIQPHEFASEAAVTRYAVELGTLLFGSRTVVDRWLLKNKEARLEESMVLKISEQLLTEGFVATWKETHNPAQSRLLSKVADGLANFPYSKWAYLRFPFELRSRQESRIPDEIVTEILQGTDYSRYIDLLNNSPSLRDLSKVEAYNTTRRIYRYAVMGTLLVFQIILAYQQFEQEQERMAAEALEALKSTQSTLADITKVKAEIIEAAYQAALQEFKQKYGDKPEDAITPAEAQALRQKIEKLVSESAK